MTIIVRKLIPTTELVSAALAFAAEHPDAPRATREATAAA